MKVLVVSGVFPPVPLAEANHAMHLAEALARHGVEVHVLTTKGALTEGFPFRVHAVMAGWSWTDIPRFQRFLRECSPDAILMLYISFMYQDHPMATFAPSLAKAVLPGVRFVTQFENVLGVRGHSCPPLTRIIRRLVKQWAGPADVDMEYGTLLRDSDRVIVLSGRIEQTIAKEYREVLTKTVLIPPPPLIPMTTEEPRVVRANGRAKLKIDADTFVLMFFGYLYKDKGVETLLEAFQRVRQRGRHVHLVIAGGIAAHWYDQRVAYVKELEQLAVTLGIQEDVTWTGYIEWNSADASRYFYAADACVLPFDYGVSMNNSTFAAAAAHALPIISTHGPILEAPFVQGDNVLLCPPVDPGALAAAIESLIDEPALRSRLAAGALAMRAEWFSWDRATERTMAALT